MSSFPNHLYYGDNLDVMRRYVEDESVDLVYLDPPFKSNQDYNIYDERSGAQVKAFEDTWPWDQAAAEAFEEVVEAGGQLSETMQAFQRIIGHGDMLAYLTMMAPRLIELRRALKETGSIYLHCDPTASHYIKVLMDGIFGHKNFRSEIIWRRTNAHNKITRQYGPIHDTILFYSVSDKFTFHPGRTPYSKAYIEDRFKHEDHRGRYQTNYLTGPGIRRGASGKPWGDFDPTSAGRHWAIPRSLRPYLPDDGGMTSQEALEALSAQDLIVFPKKKGGQPMYKQYVGEGVPYQDIWTYQPNTHGVLYGNDACIDQDIKYLEHEEEKLGYETQKPVGVLKRIIETSSDPGDVVFDPFCGCGTTIYAAHETGRQWIGCDVAILAIRLIKDILESERYRLVTGENFKIDGIPNSCDSAMTLFEASPNSHPAPSANRLQSMGGTVRHVQWAGRSR